MKAVLDVEDQLTGAIVEHLRQWLGADLEVARLRGSTSDFGAPELYLRAAVTRLTCRLRRASRTRSVSFPRCWKWHRNMLWRTSAWPIATPYRVGMTSGLRGSDAQTHRELDAAIKASRNDLGLHGVCGPPLQRASTGSGTRPRRSPGDATPISGFKSHFRSALRPPTCASITPWIS
jgi:hypothetical protein